MLGSNSVCNISETAPVREEGEMQRGLHLVYAVNLLVLELF